MSARELRRDFRDGRRLFNDVVGGIGDIFGARDRIRGDVGRDRAYGYNGAYRGDVAEDRYRDYRDRRDDDDRDDDRRPGRGDRERDDRRGDFIRDPRRAGLGSGQRRDDGYDAPSRDRMEQATEDYVFALANAALSPAGSPERASAIKEARDILTDPQNGLMRDGADGAVRFPEGMRVVLDGRGRNARGIKFEGIYSRAPSADEAIRRGVNAVAETGIGSPLTAADLAALRGTDAPTITPGTDAAAPTVPAADPTANPTPPAGTPAPGANPPTNETPAPAGTTPPAAAKYTIPAAETGAPLAGNYDGKPQLKMTPAQVEAFQLAAMAAGGPLGEAIRNRGGADKKPGQATYAAMVAAFAPDKPEDINFADPAQLAKAMERMNSWATPAAAPAPAAAAATAAPTAAALDSAVSALTQLSGTDKVLNAAELAQLTPENKQAIGTVLNVNGGTTIDNAELTAVVAAAQAKGITFEAGATVDAAVAALAPVFNGVTVPATAVAEPIEYVSNPVVQPLKSANSPAAAATTSTAASTATDGAQQATGAPADNGAAVAQADVGQVSAQPITEQGIKDAAETLQNLALQENKTITQELIAEYSKDSGMMSQIAPVFDLNKNNRVEALELVQIVAAATTGPNAITVEGGAKALNPLFAGVSFAPTQPTASAPATEDRAASVSVPPPVSSELAGLDLNSVDGPNAGLPNLNAGGPRQVGG